MYKKALLGMSGEFLASLIEFLKEEKCHCHCA